MSEPQLRAALDALAPPVEWDGVEWQEVRRRAARLRRRRRRATVLLAAALSAAAFGVLAASGQIGALVSHSKAPHLVVRATLSTAGGERVGTFQVEIERAVVAFRNGVRVIGWRTPSGDAFGARWFLDVRGSDQVTASLRPIQTLCTACSPHSSGKLTLTRAQVAALVRGAESITVTTSSGERVRGTPVLDRTSLRRGVMCLRPGVVCTRIYTGRP
jgi:hypothetical protein